MAVHSRYLDIAAQIRARIEAGEWEPGAKLPRLDDFAAEYGANRDTVGRAIAALEAEGVVWAVQGRGIIVRHGMMRLRRPRGNLVKRNVVSPGYSFPSASGQEVWKHHIPPEASLHTLDDPRIAKLLGVAVGSEVMRRFRVTGPEAEPPFQINISWIHPRGFSDAPEVASNSDGGHKEAGVDGVGSVVWGGPISGTAVTYPGNTEGGRAVIYPGNMGGG